MRTNMSIHALALTLTLLLISAAVGCNSPRQPTRSSAPEQMFVIPLKFASAEELAPELAGLLRDPQDPSRAEPECNVLSDPRTNSLLVALPAGSFTTERDIRQIVSSLDVRVTH